MTIPVANSGLVASSHRRKPSHENAAHSEHLLRNLGMRYLLWAPERWTRQHLLVAVHGISRNWHELAQLLAPYCEAADTALVVPRFSRDGYRGYQRLEAGRRGIPADRVLAELLEDAAERLGVEPRPSIRMFGFSGGAQFSHRFALAHPGRVQRLALVAAGFYTMPDHTVPFPYGTAASDRASDLGRGPFDSKALTLPVRVLVGDRDTERDPELRKGAELDRRQGRNRAERAKRFVIALRALSASRGLVPDCSLELLTGCTHSFTQCAGRGQLGLRAMRFLFPERADQLAENARSSARVEPATAVET